MDPIADMLTAIRNALAVGKPTVVVPFSKIKYEITQILTREGFIEKAIKHDRKTKKTIEIYLKYKDKVPVISGLKKVSKPGQRIYLPARKIKRVKSGYGLAVISTSQGLMTDREARKQNLGGEIIAEIW
ncbi:MAG: 30S ribosomal protein S8 [Minisyncoccales bacterium]